MIKDKDSSLTRKSKAEQLMDDVKGTIQKLSE